MATRTPPRDGGFTILEVMFAVAIIGILAALAVPSYTNYIKKTRTTEAVKLLGSIRNMQRAYFINEELGAGENYAPDLETLHWEVRGGGTAAKYYNYVCDDRSAMAIAKAGARFKVSANTVRLVFERDTIGGTARIYYESD